MKDVTQQLADALRELLVAVHYADPPKNYGTEDEPNICHEARIPVGFVEPAHRALTAFEASRAAPDDDVVERVKAAIAEGLYYGLPQVDAALVPDDLAASLTRAALSAMPRDEGLDDVRFLVDRLVDFGNDGDARTDDGERDWHGHVAPALSRVRNKLAATERGEG